MVELYISGKTLSLIENVSANSASLIIKKVLSATPYSALAGIAVNFLIRNVIPYEYKSEGIILSYNVVPFTYYVDFTKFNEVRFEYLGIKLQ